MRMPGGTAPLKEMPELTPVWPVVLISMAPFIVLIAFFIIGMVK